MAITTALSYNGLDLVFIVTVVVSKARFSGGGLVPNRRVTLSSKYGWFPSLQLPHLFLFIISTHDEL